MTAGLSAVNLVNPWLNLLRNVSFTAKTNVYVKLHTGDPGSDGTGNASSVTTRSEVTFAAASAGSMSANNTPSWSNWAGTNGEVVSHVSLWDASTSGNFLGSDALNASKTMNTGDQLNLTAFTISITPIAA
ncbi:hypothetical protein ACIBEJ_34975 [Nonomuraea sp. NPDC050790]|uniref:phage tail fiber protein n=1 Tax=Nonomuraea sp. NPDC050790 TaxID=3364371 RepID=UPI0037954462